MTDPISPAARAIAMAGALAAILASVAPTMAAEAGTSRDICAVASAAHAIVCPASADQMAAAVKPIWQRRTDNAYFAVYAHYCAPDLEPRAAIMAPGIEVAVYGDHFRVDYDGDCRAFYLNEVATRL